MLEPSRFRPQPISPSRYHEEDRVWKARILEYLPLIDQNLTSGFYIQPELQFLDKLRLTVMAGPCRPVLTKEYRRLLPKPKSKRHDGIRMVRSPHRVARSFARLVRAQGLSDRKTRHPWEDEG